MKKISQNGFSLIELLIVVMVIGIVAVIAIPNMLAARRSANEGAAISALRTLHGAQSVYQTSMGAGNYAGTVGPTGDTSGLSVLYSARLIDEVLGAGVKSGYNFTGARTVSNDTTPATFFFSANPVSDTGVTQSGTRRFCITQQGFLGNDWANLSTAFNQTTVLTANAVNN